MLQGLVRLAYPYGSVRRVQLGPARSLRFIVAPGIGFSYAWGVEAAAPRHFAHWIKPGMTVYDAGGNKGQMALLFAALVGPRGRVVTFEPVPAEADQLARNLTLNALSNVSLVRAAAADKPGVLTFTYSPDRPSEGKLRDVEHTYSNPDAGAFQVQAVTLDEIATREPPPDVIKIDVEGAAASLLRGARRILDTRPPVIYVELHGPEEQAGLRDELQSRGYTLTNLAGEVVPDPVAVWQSPLWCHPRAQVTTGNDG